MRINITPSGGRKPPTAAGLIPWVLLNAANLTYDVVNHANLLLTFGRPTNLRNALTLGTSMGQNRSREDCMWRKDNEPCPDPLINFSLYKMDLGSPRWSEEMKISSKGWDKASKEWIRKRHDYTKLTVVLIHGYAGVADNLPMGVLRDAYLMTGQYNVYQVDWTELTPIPCYPSSVYNVRGVARCVARFLSSIKAAGVPVETTTCVGHSLGAHVCGIASTFLDFSMHKIIGIDPARPLIRSSPRARLDEGDAVFVQAIHTSATFGDSWQRSGHVDFCINGARKQPYCFNTTNQALCSHVRSVCYLAESLLTPRMASPCMSACTSKQPKVLSDSNQILLPMGHQTSETAKGLYCVTTDEAPFCPSETNPIGNPLCCVTKGGPF